MRQGRLAGLPLPDLDELGVMPREGQIMAEARAVKAFEAVLDGAATSAGTEDSVPSTRQSRSSRVSARGTEKRSAGLAVPLCLYGSWRAQGLRECSHSSPTSRRRAPHACVRGARARASVSAPARLFFPARAAARLRVAARLELRCIAAHKRQPTRQAHAEGLQRIQLERLRRLLCVEEDLEDGALALQPRALNALQERCYSAPQDVI